MSYAYVVHCNNMFVYSLSQGGRFSSHVGASELIGREGGVCKQEEGLLWWTQPESQDRVILESWVEAHWSTGLSSFNAGFSGGLSLHFSSGSS